MDETTIGRVHQLHSQLLAVIITFLYQSAAIERSATTYPSSPSIQERDEEQWLLCYRGRPEELVARYPNPLAVHQFVFGRAPARRAGHPTGYLLGHSARRGELRKDAQEGGSKCSWIL